VEPFSVKFKIERKQIDMELDSGALITSLIKLKTYNGENINLVGKGIVSKEYKSKKEQCNLLIVKNLM